MAHRVSVLMPIYNCIPYLDQALWSVRNQSFADFECIMVNDGSTDDSLAVLCRHATEDPRFIVVDKLNGGIVSALNAGLERCSGEFIARMDGDDICLPHRFGQQVRFLSEHPEVAMVGGWARVIDGDGQEMNACSCGQQDPNGSCWCSFVQTPTSHSDIEAGLVQGTYTLLHPTIMARASLMRRIGGYDPAFCVAEDLDMFLRMGEIGLLANLPEFVLSYRRRQNSQTLIFRAGIPKWDAHALRSAKARGRSISRSSVARLEERTSWNAASAGCYREAMSSAIRAITIAPWSITGYRAIARAGWRAFTQT